MTTIAFLGLGNMGGPMAANLVAAGHTVRGFDPVPALKAAAEGQGRQGLRQRRRGRRRRRRGDHLAAQRRDRQGAATPRCCPPPRPARLFIDTSTISVDDARDIHAQAAERGFRAARRTGVRRRQGRDRRHAGVHGRRRGRRRRARHARCWNRWRARSFTAAAPATGQSAKLCNNMVLAVQQIAVGEAFVLAEKLGLSAQSLFDVITGATGNCWAVHTNCPVPGPVPTSPANNDFKPGFATALMNKDLGLAMAAVNSTGFDGAAGQPRRRDLREVRRRPRRQGLQRGHRTAPQGLDLSPRSASSSAARRSPSFDESRRSPRTVGVSGLARSQCSPTRRSCATGLLTPTPRRQACGWRTNADAAVGNPRCSAASLRCSRAAPPPRRGCRELRRP